MAAPLVLGLPLLAGPISTGAMASGTPGQYPPGWGAGLAGPWPPGSVLAQTVLARGAGSPGPLLPDPSPPDGSAADRVGTDGVGPGQLQPVRLAGLTGAGIPAVVLGAYQGAVAQLSVTNPGCRLPWTVLAGIGKVESNHGRDGAGITAAGTVLPPILGPVLNGTGGNAAIPDTDGGRLDGDPVWDRAVGPMQFIPGTWRGVAPGGNPNNIGDATLAAGRYLCSGGRNLSDPRQLAAALYAYNPSSAYVAVVLSWVAAYDATGAAGVPTASLPVLTALPPLPALPPRPDASALPVQPARPIAPSNERPPAVPAASSVAAIPQPPITPGVVPVTPPPLVPTAIPTAAPATPASHSTTPVVTPPGSPSSPEASLPAKPSAPTTPCPTGTPDETPEPAATSTPTPSRTPGATPTPTPTTTTPTTTTPTTTTPTTTTPTTDKTSTDKPSTGTPTPTAAPIPTTPSASPTTAKHPASVTLAEPSQSSYGFSTISIKVAEDTGSAHAVLAHRKLNITVSGIAYQAVTDATGVAQLTPTPPLLPGKHSVSATLDDPQYAGQLATSTRVLTDAAEVVATGFGASTASPPADGCASGTAIADAVRASWNGHVGTLTVRAPELPASAAEVTALGVSPDGTSVAIAAVDEAGRRLLVRLGAEGGPTPGLSIWVGGVQSPRGASASAGSVKITRLP